MRREDRGERVIEVGLWVLGVAEEAVGQHGRAVVEVEEAGV